MGNEIIATPKRPLQTLEQLVIGMHKQMESVLPKHLSPDRMARLAVTALRTTPKLAACTPASFLSSIMACSALGLEPNTPLGQAYLIPFDNNRKVGNEWQKVSECQLIVGYQGYIDLMRRSGQVASVQATAVYEGDEFEYELGLSPTLRHKPSNSEEREDKPLTYVYCVVKLKDRDADPIFLVMPRSRIEKHRKRGASGKKNFKGEQIKTPWDTDYEAMALKTVTRMISKWSPRSTEMAIAAELEDRTERGAAIAAALPQDAQQYLLESGYADTDAEPEPELEQASPIAPPEQDGRRMSLSKAKQAAQEPPASTPEQAPPKPPSVPPQAPQAAPDELPWGDVDDALVRLRNAPREDVEHLARELRTEYRWTVQDKGQIGALLDRLGAAPPPTKSRQRPPPPPNPDDDGR